LYLTELEDVVTLLKSKLEDYLILHNKLEPGKKKFKCLVHEERSPSMHINPKTELQTAHCFGCGANLDIFSAAHIIENLPTEGREWITETIPALAAQLGISVSIGEPSPTARLKTEYYKLAGDIEAFIVHPANEAKNYITQRKWLNEYESCYSVNTDELLKFLATKGWDLDFIERTGLIGKQNVSGFYPFIGKSYVTTVIKDVRRRPIAFVSRRLDDGEPKYVHSTESLIFNKSQSLLGIDLASKSAKQSGLWIVEGIGERNQLLRGGKTNVVACVGTAITDQHLYILKDLGIRNLYLCLDWDTAGQQGIERVLKTIQSKKIVGFNIYIVLDSTNTYKDLDEYLSKLEDEKIGPALGELKVVDSFTYICSNTNLKSIDDINAKIIPIIASTPVAMMREKQVLQLSKLTGISEAAIISDVERIRNQSYEQQRERILNSIDKYKAQAEQDPASVSALMSIHEKEVQQIELEYAKSTMGVNYQLQRFEALQNAKTEANAKFNAFQFGYYTFFADAFAKGLPWTEGSLFYFGGRENAGKTATMIALACDIAFSDPDVVVLFHFIDDNYKKLEGRFLTNFAFLQHQKQKLSIYDANNPTLITDPEISALYKTAALVMRNLIASEKIIVMDGEDGTTLSVIEKQLRYLRMKYPNKKLLCVADNTHDYTDHPNLDQTQRMKLISLTQKNLGIKYKCAMWATVEYRKNSQGLDTGKIKWPSNDDIADSRGLKYKADVIIHVYNDHNDRKENCEIFWSNPMHPEKKLPRLALDISKNKISSFKDKLAVDLDPDTTTLKQITMQQAIREIEYGAPSTEPSRSFIPRAISSGLEIDTDYNDEDDKDF
jgi:DNA primase catalytic core